MKSFLIVVFLLIGNLCYSQAYLNVSSGFNNRYAFSIQSKSESIENFYWGFGISLFTNKGNRGQDFTGFIPKETYEVITPIFSKDASIFTTFGFGVKSDFIISGKLGFATNKFIYNGRGISNSIIPDNPNLEWYVVRDGGTKFLYGIDVTKRFKNFSIGSSYDNFNGLMATVGLRFY